MALGLRMLMSPHLQYKYFPRNEEWNITNWELPFALTSPSTVSYLKPMMRKVSIIPVKDMAASHKQEKLTGLCAPQLTVHFGCLARLTVT
jgi:hypothetical protein